MAKFILTPTLDSDQHSIAAIKAIREVTRLGLKDAKDLYDRMKLSRQPLEIESSSQCSFTPEQMETLLRTDGGFAVEVVKSLSPPISHRDEAEKHLAELVKELVTAKKYETATNVANLLSMLVKAMEENQ
jgi:hypothetical protein